MVALLIDVAEGRVRQHTEVELLEDALRQLDLVALREVADLCVALALIAFAKLGVERECVEPRPADELILSNASFEPVVPVLAFELVVALAAVEPVVAALAGEAVITPKSEDVVADAGRKRPTLDVVVGVDPVAVFGAEDEHEVVIVDRGGRAG